MKFLILFVLVVLSVFVWIYISNRKRANLIERLNYGLAERSQAEESLWDGASNLLQLESIRSLLYSSTLTRKFDLMIKRGQLDLSLPQALMVFVSASILPAIPVYFFWKNSVAIVASLVVLPLLLWMFLSWRAKLQQSKVDAQLPSLISSFLTTINAGGTPLQALHAVSKNAPEPIASSVSVILESIQLGRPPQTAWHEWAEFWGTNSTKLLATGIKIKWETGGQMSAILRHILETLEFNRRMELRISTLTAQSKLSAWVLSALPLALGVMVKIYRPDLYDGMINDELGQSMLMVAAGLTVMGFFTLQRIAKLKT